MHFIDTVVKVILFIASSYFDSNDFDAPIHHYLRASDIHSRISNLYQEVTYFVRRNEVSMSDSIWFGSQGGSNVKEFYSINQASTILNDDWEDWPYIYFVISLDKQVDQYQRTVYSLFDMLGFIGGIYEILKAWGFIIVNAISAKAFYSSLISKLYHVEFQAGQHFQHDQSIKTNTKTSRFNQNFVNKNNTKVVPKDMNNISNIEMIGINSKVIEESKVDSSLSHQFISKK